MKILVWLINWSPSKNKNNIPVAQIGWGRVREKWILGREELSVHLLNKIISRFRETRVSPYYIGQWKSSKDNVQETVRYVYKELEYDRITMFTLERYFDAKISWLWLSLYCLKYYIKNDLFFKCDTVIIVIIVTRCSE